MTSSLNSLPKNLDGQLLVVSFMFVVVVVVVVVFQTIGNFRVALDVIMKARLRA